MGELVLDLLVDLNTIDDTGPPWAFVNAVQSCTSGRSRARWRATCRA